MTNTHFHVILFGFIDDKDNLFSAVSLLSFISSFCQVPVFPSPSYVLQMFLPLFQKSLSSSNP